MTTSRVVITGLGAVSPLGLTVEEMWAGLSAGPVRHRPDQGVRPDGLSLRVGRRGPPLPNPGSCPQEPAEIRQADVPGHRAGRHGGQEAVASSGLITKGIDPEKVNVDPTRMAINMGAGMISCDLAELGPATAASIVDGRFDIRKWGREGLSHITPLWLLKYLPNMLACHIGIIHDIQGPSNTITCAEASAHLAIGEAAQVIARGNADIALAGGAEAKINLMVMVRQNLLKRAVPNRNDAPESACRPFDAEAAGSVFGEGAGVIVLETLDHARSRQAKILAELVGIGQSHSIHPAYEKMEPDGKGIRIADREGDGRRGHRSGRPGPDHPARDGRPARRPGRGQRRSKPPWVRRSDESRSGRPRAC